MSLCVSTSQHGMCFRSISVLTRKHGPSTSVKHLPMSHRNRWLKSRSHLRPRFDSNSRLVLSVITSLLTGWCSGVIGATTLRYRDVNVGVRPRQWPTGCTQHLTISGVSAEQIELPSCHPSIRFKEARASEQASQKSSFLARQFDNSSATIVSSATHTRSDSSYSGFRREGGIRDRYRCHARSSESVRGRVG